MSMAPSNRPKIGLDNTTFRGRLRQPPQRMARPTRLAAPQGVASNDVRPPVSRIQTHTPLPIAPPTSTTTSQGIIAPQPTTKPQPSHATAKITGREVLHKTTLATPTANIVQPQISMVQAQPYAKPAIPKQQRSQVLRRPPSNNTKAAKQSKFNRLKQGVDLSRYSKMQLTLVGMAAFVFLVGLFVSLQTFRTNSNAASQVAALSKKADDGAATTDANDAPPSTTKPSAKAVAAYAVAPDLAKYLSIPKLHVHARVLQVGIKANGELATPSNVFDTAWYTGSAKPGEPGATLIDGHVSSWTTHGVFYGIKTLTAGDTMQITRGDNSVVNYRVVRTQAYDAEHVDMQAAITPVTKGKSGLNLITCTGKVKPGTNEFTERELVFAEQY